MNTAAAGEPFFADPRQVLRHAMRPLQELGLTAVVATELEFYLLSPRLTSPRRKSAASPAREAAGRTAVRQHGGRRGRRPLRGAVLGPVCGAEHPGRSDAQGILARTVRGQPPPCPERGARLRSRGAAEAGGSRQWRDVTVSARASWRNCSRTAGRLQPARPRQPHRRSPAATSSLGRASDGPFSERCVTWSAGLRPRWARPWRSSRRPRTRIGAIARSVRADDAELGNQPPWRGAADPLSGAEDTRIEHRPGGADGNPYLVMAAIMAASITGSRTAATRADSAPGPGRRGRSRCPCARRRPSMPSRRGAAPALSRASAPQLFATASARKRRSYPCPDQRARRTSGDLVGDLSALSRRCDVCTSSNRPTLFHCYADVIRYSLLLIRYSADHGGRLYPDEGRDRRAADRQRSHLVIDERTRRSRSRGR